MTTTQYQGIRPDQAYALGRDVARVHRFLERRVLTPEVGQTSEVERIIAQITEEATKGFSLQALYIFKSGYGDYLASHPIRQPIQSQ